MSAGSYDEFGLLHENAAEAGLPFDPTRPPRVSRSAVRAPSGHTISALAWGEGAAELVLLHGGGQNAHTWDTVALALDRPLVAIDLPGHGHSDWRPDKRYRPQEMAEDVAFAIEHLAPEATTLAGMSLGGLTALAALAERGELAERLALVDITPGVNAQKAEPILSFLDGPEVFASFDEILERTMAFNPTRSRSSLRRGVLHNAREREDGTWVWRYDLPTGERLDDLEHRFADLWDAVSALSCPLLLVQGGLSSVVDDDDVAELQRRKPGTDVIVVEDAGHSVQGDRPLELARILAAFHEGHHEGHTPAT
ncbi:alpha/beta fold hydrolase [Rhabdothermincola sp.]|uniref:alpha/beta fold hydrolase n=1 Tax=Rhabdothermincola sp. TaxID=2820405 RepID=UPI002FDF665F